MQLIIKLYNDKAPRLGIIYPTEYSAGKSFEPLTATHQAESFRARIELNRDRATLTLSSVHGSSSIIYKDLAFKVEQLQKLQTFIKPVCNIEFYHVYWKENSLFVGKVKGRNPLPLLITRYEIVTPQSF